MLEIVFSGILGIVFSIFQLLLLRRVTGVRTKWLRVVLLLLKLPLWALTFIGVALYWGAGPLIAFALTAGATYLAVVAVFYLRARRKEG